MLAEYGKANAVTRERMYLETMERILGKVEKKVIIDKDVAKRRGADAAARPAKPAVGAVTWEAR